MHEVLEFLKGFNGQTLIGIALLLWLFSTHTNGKIEKLESTIDKRLEKQDEQIRKQDQRTDKLYEMFIDLLKEQKKGT